MGKIYDFFSVLFRRKNGVASKVGLHEGNSGLTIGIIDLNHKPRITLRIKVQIFHIYTIISNACSRSVHVYCVYPYVYVYDRGLWFYFSHKMSNT